MGSFLLACILKFAKGPLKYSFCLLFIYFSMTTSTFGLTASKPSLHWKFFHSSPSMHTRALTWWFHQGCQWWLHWYAPRHSRESSPRLRGTDQWRLWTPKTCSVGCWLESARPLLGRHLSHPPSLPCNRVSPAWWRYCYCCYFHSASVNQKQREQGEKKRIKFKTHEEDRLFLACYITYLIHSV